MDRDATTGGGGPMTILFGGPAEERAAWAPQLGAAAEAAGLDMRLILDPAEADPGAVDAILYSPEGPVKDFAPYTRLKAVLSMWAGVEKIAPDAGITVPLTRMVDDGLALGMRDWVVAHVMARHMRIDLARATGEDDWPKHVPPLARDRRVTVLGLGELGATAATGLAGLGFPVTGWSRRPKDIAGVDCLSGPDGLRDALARADFLITLLPLTAATENLLDADALALLPRAAEVFNPGRGALIDDDALLAALASGQVAHATLDVFRQEPLPRGHPFRRHPAVTVTPHVAAATRPETAAPALIDQIIRLRDGAALRHVVDRAAGY